MENMNFMATLAKNIEKEIKVIDAVEKDRDFGRTDITLTDMQKLMYIRLKKERMYCNWCGTGAGKTISALFTAHNLNCKLVVIVCPNNVKGTWINNIKGYVDKNGKRVPGIYPDSNVMNVNSVKDVKKFNRNEFTYVIINYDKFSVATGMRMMQTLAELNRIDFICFDELQFMKNEDSNRYGCVLQLRRMAEERNPKVYVAGMTATPYTKDLCEIRALVELITLKEYKEIGNRDSYANRFQAFKALQNLGFRYVHDTGIIRNEPPIIIDGNDLLPEIMTATTYNDYVIRWEKILTNRKMNTPEVVEKIEPGTIIYSQYRDAKNNDAIINIITKKIEELGFTYTVYSGGEKTDKEREKILKSFIHGGVDVLVATAPITTGIDGLQMRSNKIIMIGYPDTATLYDQLVGRIDRQGSEFKEVYIYQPEIHIMLSDGTDWSYDYRHRAKIMSRKNLSEALLTGNFNNVYNMSTEKINRKLRKIINERTITDYTPEREICEYVGVEYTQKTGRTINPEAFREYNESILKDTHKMAESSNHETFHSKCMEDPDIMKQYHEARENAKQGWPVDPVDEIGKKINSLTFNKLNVADMGCGTCKLRTILDKHNVICIDHTGVVPGVIQADMANLNGIIDNDSIDVAIYCLSLWGKNYQDYFKEAHRILKNFGIMYIVVPTGKYDKDELISTVCSYGFKNTDVEICNDSVHEFMYLEFSKR